MGAFNSVDENGRDWCLALRELASKSAADNLSVLKEILSDLSEVVKSLDTNANPRGQEILKGFTRRMRDKAATETLLTTLLEDYQNEDVPELISAEEAAELNNTQVAAVRQIDEYFCGLHDIVHATEAAVKSTKEWELNHFEDGKIPVYNAKYPLPAADSGASRLVQETCKALASGADERNGCFGDWIAHAKSILRDDFSTTKNPFTKFLGSRFNILGRNAVYCYGLRHVIGDFLKLRESNNMLLGSVAFGYKQPQFIVGLRNFGILSMLILVPLWNQLEDKNICMADMKTTYRDMLKFFDENAADPTPILEGNSPFPEAYIKRNNWLQLLLDADEQLDGPTSSSMALMMQSLAIFARRQFKEFLPGGKYDKLTPEQCRGVPKTNKKCESYFAYWDHEVGWRFYFLMICL